MTQTLYWARDDLSAKHCERGKYAEAMVFTDLDELCQHMYERQSDFVQIWMQTRASGGFMDITQAVAKWLHDRCIDDYYQGKDPEPHPLADRFFDTAHRIKTAKVESDDGLIWPSVGQPVVARGW